MSVIQSGQHVFPLTVSDIEDTTVEASNIDAVVWCSARSLVCLSVWSSCMDGGGVLDAQTQNGDEPVGEITSFPGQSCLSSANSC